MNPFPHKYESNPTCRLCQFLPFTCDDKRYRIAFILKINIIIGAQ